jgi:hypothetical protein
LQGLLDIRDAEERQAYRVLLAAVRGHARERERATQLEDERVRITRSFNEPNARLVPDIVRETYLTLELVVAASARQDRVVDLARERELTSRAAFAAARREHRRISVLRERAYAAYVDGVERREADELDAANAAKQNASTLIAYSFHN